MLQIFRRASNQGDMMVNSDYSTHQQPVFEVILAVHGTLIFVNEVQYLKRCISRIPPTRSHLKHDDHADIHDHFVRFICARRPDQSHKLPSILFDAYMPDLVQSVHVLGYVLYCPIRLFPVYLVIE